MGPPEKFLVVPDEFHLKHAGRCAGGRSVITASQPIGSPAPTDGAPGSTRDFICTFWWDDDGRLVDHRIDEVGLRGSYHREAIDVLWRSHFEAVGAIEPTPFWVRPFSVDFAKRQFGLIAEKNDAQDWQVIFEPGSTMAFYAPWDEGGYDT